MHAFRSQTNENRKTQPLWGTPGNARPLTWVLIRQIEQCIIANRIWQWQKSRGHWVTGSEYKTPAHRFVAMPQHLLAYNQVHVQQRILSLRLGSCDDRSSTAYLLFAVRIESVYSTCSFWVRVWDTACWLVAKPQPLLAYDTCSGSQESPGYILLWLTNHCMVANPSGNEVSQGNDEYLCWNMRHQLTYYWQSRNFCSPMTKVQVHQRILGIS